MSDNEMASPADDQAQAAAADARQRLDDGPERWGQIEHGPDPALSKLAEMLGSSARTVSRQCKHLPATGIAPANWLPSDSGTWYCDGCAERVMERWRRDGYPACDLCGASLAAEPHPVLVHTRIMHVLIHAVTCRQCAPGTG